MNTQSEVRAALEVEELNQFQIECVNGGFAFLAAPAFMLAIRGAPLAYKGAKWVGSAAAAGVVGGAVTGGCRRRG